MKKILLMLTLLTVLARHSVKAQCPPGAFAYLSADQTCGSGCSVLLLGWPEGSVVNIYGGNPITIVASALIPGVYGNIGTNSAYTCVPCNMPLIFASTSPNSTTGCVIVTIGVLPIKFATFSVTIQNNKCTLISWTTGLESAPVKYSIQKSEDGNTFADIATLIGLQRETNQYRYTDFTENKKSVYYRVAVTDLSGKQSYSEVALVKNGTALGISLYPNPAAADFKVSLPARFLPAQLQIFDAQGALVHMQKVSASTCSISKYLSKGMYQVKVTAGNGLTSVQRLIKN